MKAQLGYLYFCLLVGCQPVATIDWKDFKKNTSEMILSKWGIIGGTLATFGILAATWYRWFSSTVIKNNTFPITHVLTEEIDNILKTGGSTAKKIEVLDRIYQQQRWPTFSSYVPSLLGAQLDITGLVNFIDQTLTIRDLDDLRKSPEEHLLWSYIITKELMTLDLVMIRNVRMLPQNTTRLLATLAPHFIISNLPSKNIFIDLQLEKRALSRGSIKMCIEILDILYAVQKNKRVPNFHSRLIQALLQNGFISNTITKKELIDILARKDEQLKNILEKEKLFITNMNNVYFINENDRVCAAGLINRLIMLTQSQ